MEDYNSLGKSQGYSWGGGLDKDYMALAKELSFFKNVVLVLDSKCRSRPLSPPTKRLGLAWRPTLRLWSCPLR
eukprot:9737899-Lingulodinium_polyedra.AAC.1